MDLPRRKAETVIQALEDWQKQDLLSPDQVQTLIQTIRITPFDWKRLARYSFWNSIFCIVIAVSALLMDQVLLQLLALYFNAPPLAKCIGLAVISALLYGVAVRARQRSPERVLRNEALFFFGVLATAGTLSHLFQALQWDEEKISLTLLLACGVYGGLGLYLRSSLIWVFSLLSLGSWLGAETGYASGWGAYYLGMNYPLRFAVFGAMLLMATALCQPYKFFEPFYKASLVIGLLYFFIALWILSIFGNYGDMAIWLSAPQYKLFLWSVLFGAAAVGAIFHGLTFDNPTTRGFGLVFLFINLYTRFFEIFWNSMHKAIFFALLGISFWYLGSYAEKLWNKTGDWVKKPEEKP